MLRALRWKLLSGKFTLMNGFRTGKGIKGLIGALGPFRIRVLEELVVDQRGRKLLLGRVPNERAEVHLLRVDIDSLSPLVVSFQLLLEILLNVHLGLLFFTLRILKELLPALLGRYRIILFDKLAQLSLNVGFKLL